MFLFDCLRLSCLSSHSSMLNIFAVFWNTGINWMIAYKMGWVVGFIYIHLHSQPQQSPLTHAPTPEHDSAAETANEQHFISSVLSREKTPCVFSLLHPASFPLADGLRWINAAPQALWEKNSQSTLAQAAIYYHNWEHYVWKCKTFV